MLSIFADWIYILFTTFCMGFGFFIFVDRVLHYKVQRMDSILVAGLAIATVYAQIFSLLYRVNIEANILMLVVCFVIVIIWRQQIFAFLREAYQKSSRIRKILIPILLLIWCYFTSRGYMVPDTDLYHAQSIRWIEEYGVVKGQGLLNGRFAYNSSIFSVTALYSLKFILGRSLHTLNGWLAFVMSVGLLDLGKCFQRKKMLLSDFARVAAAYYLTLIWDEVVAPSPDYFVMCILFFIAIKWLTQLEASENSDNIAPYSLLCVLGAYALTLKLAAGLILVLLLKPAFILLKKKRWKDIAVYMVLGLLTTVPWMTRTVFISGWLFYPFAALDLFSVDWKMRDVWAINIDAAQIKVWAKAANEMGINAPLRQWFPHWFMTSLSSMQKLVVAGDLISCVIVPLAGVKLVIKKQWKQLEVLFVLFAMMSSYLYWQLSAPMPRYGYAYMLLLPALTMGYLLQNRKISRVVYALFMVFGLYKFYIGFDYIMNSYLEQAYIWQIDYHTYDVESYDLNGVTIYIWTESLSGYGPVPACNWSSIEEGLELRGDGIKDGFRMKY